jgi:Tat protein translocase TatB subunit
MGNVGGGEVLVILLVALLILGPAKLPEVARQAGRAMAEFRKVTSGFQRELNDALHDDSDARARGAAVAAARPPLVHDLNTDTTPATSTADATGEPASVPSATADAAVAPIPAAPDSEDPRTESDTDR